MPLVQNKSLRSKNSQDYIDNKVPENFIPGFCNPPLNDDRDQSNCFTKNKISFFQTGKDILRNRLVSNNQNHKNNKNVKKTDSKKTNSSSYRENNVTFNQESKSLNKMRKRSCSMNQLYAEDSHDSDFLRSNLESKTSPNERGSPQSSPRLPNSSKPTNNINLLHPEITTKRKISNVGRSYSLTSSNLYSTSKGEDRHRRQSLFDDQLKLKKIFSNSSLCSKMSVNQSESLNDYSDKSLIKFENLEKVSNKNIIQQNLNNKNFSLEVPKRQSLEADDSVNCDAKITSRYENNKRCSLRRSFSDLQSHGNNFHSLIPEIHVQVNDSCVKLTDDESRQTDESIIKYDGMYHSSDSEIGQTLYRPRSQSLVINSDNDEKSLESPILRRQSWSSSNFLKATSMVELNCRKIKVIKTEQFFVRRNSYHKSDNMYDVQGNSNHTSNNDQNNISFQPLKNGTVGRKISLSENLISFKKKDEVNISSFCTTASIFNSTNSTLNSSTSTFNSTNSTFNSTTSTLNSSTLTCNEIKKNIETKLRAYLPITFQATVIDPLSIHERKSIRLKNNINCELNRPRSPSLAFLKSSPKIRRKQTVKVGRVDSEKSNEGLQKFISVKENKEEIPNNRVKSKKWQTRQIKERQVSESSGIVHITGTSVFQRALRYTKSYDESLFPREHQSVPPVESSSTTSEESIKTKSSCNNFNETDINNLGIQTELRGADTSYNANRSCSGDIYSKKRDLVKNDFSNKGLEDIQNKNKSFYPIKVQELSKTSDNYKCASSPPSCSKLSAVLQIESSDNNNNKVYKSQFSYALKHHVNTT